MNSRYTLFTICIILTNNGVEKIKEVVFLNRSERKITKNISRSSSVFILMYFY